jgi:hypothetical protein
MEFQGNLSDFSPAQLLNLIHLAGQSGILRFESAAGRASLSFRDGTLAHACLQSQPMDLADLLKHSSIIDQSVFRMLKDGAGSISEKELGLELVNAGTVSSEEVLNHIRQYTEHLLSSLLTWQEGIFHFDAGAQPPDDKILLRLHLDGLVGEHLNQIAKTYPPQAAAIALPEEKAPIDGRNAEHASPKTIIDRFIQKIRPKASDR